MNLLARKSGLSFFLAVLILFSCKKENTNIGLELKDPDNPLGFLFTDTVSIVAETVLMKDSLVTSKSDFLTTGRYSDPFFGQITAETYTQFLHRTENRHRGNNPVADSVVLILFQSELYGDKSKALTLTFHELTGDLNKEQVYTVESPAPAYNTTPLATYTFLPASQTSIRVSLPKSFGNNILQNGPATNADFATIIKGLAILSTSSTGAFVKYSSTLSVLRVHYHNDDQNSQILEFTFGGNAARFNRIIGNRSGTTIADLVNHEDALPSSQTSDLTFIQAGTGVVTRIKMPHLLNLKEQGHIIVNKAILKLNIKSGSNDLNPIHTINLYRLTPEGSYLKRFANNAYQYAPVQRLAADQNSISFPAIGYYEDRGIYQVDLTTYMQAIFDGSQPNNGVIIGPSLTPATFISVGRTVLNNDPASPEKIRLEIHYTFSK